MAGDRLIKLLQSAIFPTLLSIIASVIVVWFTSERWVEKHRRKREHSITLKDSSIKHWISKIDEMCPFTTYYDHFEDKVLGEPINSYEFLPYNDFIENHIKTGYPDIHEKWEEYRKSVEEYTNERASILEDIRIVFEEMSKDINIKPFYHKPGISRPDLYMHPYEIAKAILQEKEYRIMGFENWYRGKLSPQASTISGITYPQLSYRTLNLMRASKEDIEKIRDKFLEILNDFDYFHRIGTLVGHKNAIATRREEFIEQLKQIVEFIELGHDIKGKCKACIF